MKLTNSSLIVVCAILGVVIFGCAKNDEIDQSESIKKPVILPDYRLDYTGNFRFTTYKGIPTVFDGSIAIDSNSDSTILIHYQSGNSFLCDSDMYVAGYFVAKLSINESLSPAKCPSEGTTWTLYGEFNGFDTLHYLYSHGTAQWGFYHCSFVGVRLK